MSSRSFLATLVNNSLTWEGEAPPEAAAPQGVRVRVQILPGNHVSEAMVARRLAALRGLAASSAFKEIDDPVAWQREIRKDRPLPGREQD